MKCPCCGKEVEPHQMDVAFRLPDPIFTLPPEQQAVRAKIHSDLCSLDDTHYFIRGVIYVPIQQLDLNFGWGVWANVSENTFRHYQYLYDKDGSDEPPAQGVLANTPHQYETIDQPLEIQFGPADKRPTFRLTPTESTLFCEQTEGLAISKWHELIEYYSPK